MERAANVRIYRTLPRGVDVAHDIARAFPRYRVDVVLDVGANVGQSARRYLGCFPEAPEAVDIVTLDEFCASSRIERVSYLKIDTEGGDLEVLRGGERMLKGQRIDLVEVEAGMNAGNKRHVPFEALKGYLEARDYLLFAIYEQMHEWITGEPHLRRTNPAFVSRRMIAGSTAGAGAGSSTL